MRRSGAAVRALAAASHPAPSVAVTVVSVLLCAAVGLPAGRAALVGAAVLAGQLSIGWSNDRIDASRDLASARADKPAARGAISLRALGIAAALALGLAVGLSLALGWRPGLAALVLVAAGWAYNLGLKATVLSAAAYLIGFAALPAVPFLARADAAAPPWWAPPAGALLGVAAHVANVLPDLADDQATGVRGLPHRLGARRSLVLLAASLAGAAAVLAAGAWSRSPAGAVAIAAVGVLAASGVVILARRQTEAAFRLTLLLAFVDVVLLVVLSR